ncbi:hypothetical protein BV20DRAFT_1057012 [Pilatotrama ljubarskyi]|nr:hypothetical protein BV20DRAFT_1057012 [Pilatotrama ljubarskyi]
MEEEEAEAELEEGEVSDKGSAADISDDELDPESDIDFPPGVADKMARFVEKQTRRVVAELLAEEERKYAQTRKAPKTPLVLARAVRAEMLELLGITDSQDIGGVRKKKKVPLPDPLPAGAPRRFAPDKTPLFNPHWDDRVDRGVNVEYISAVVRLIRDKGVKKHTLPSRMAKNNVLVVRAAHTYFNSLRRQYQAQNDPEAQAKYAQKLQNDKRSARRTRKAIMLSDGVPIFRRFFGKAATVGVEQLIHAAWLSSEDSTDGAARHSDWERMRSKGHAGLKALEVRTMLWRSRQLNMLYLTLAVFARFKYEVFGDLDEDEERDLTDDERALYFARLAQAVARWRSVYLSNKHLYDRFRGPPANHREFPRDDKQQRRVEGMLFKQCISRKWAKKDHEHLQFYNSAPDCPSSYTIFDLELPMELIPPDDRAWLEEVGTTDAEPGETDVEEVPDRL